MSREMETDYAALFSLRGRRALVTGGTGGLGSAIAQAFLQQGADVAVCGRRPGNDTDLQETARRLGRRLLYVRCDITDERDVSAMMDEIEAQFGGLEILVNSAGMNKLLPAEEYDNDSWDRVMGLNVGALHMVTREAGRRFFLPQKYGRILNLSSVKSLIGTDRDYLAYCTTKGAVNMYTKQLACEWGKYGITVNAVAPTFVRTPINSFQLDDPVFYKKLTDRIPLGRIGQKQDIAAAAVYLCSDAASFVSGQVLCVDGGLTARQ